MDQTRAVGSLSPAAGVKGRRGVYGALRRAIVTLELAPGAALSENELAASLGVSRTPVREALILLAEEGLVKVFPKVGSFVSRVDLKAVEDAQFLRQAVELAALSAIPAKPNPQIVARIRANLAEQRQAGIEAEHFWALDEDFHRDLLDLSGHARTWATVEGAKAHLDRARRLGLGLEPEALTRFADEHRAIFDAIMAPQRAVARRLLRAHLRAVFDDIAQVRAVSPELFAGDPDSTPTRRSVAVWE
ncbi:MAG: GntR family transcriptional regulator [Bifidobacteriaceae bacterium]|jgi:DNA-binding GntR family transcriptional regulator|nr:GntR family transcriptional regulator [Bifidobacteriaceae bacterium]